MASNNVTSATKGNLGKRRFCEHCQEYVSKRTYMRHSQEAARLFRMNMDDSSSESDHSYSVSLSGTIINNYIQSILLPVSCIDSIHVYT